MPHQPRARSFIYVTVIPSYESTFYYSKLVVCMVLERAWICCFVEADTLLKTICISDDGF